MQLILIESLNPSVFEGAAVCMHETPVTILWSLHEFVILLHH